MRALTGQGDLDAERLLPTLRCEGPDGPWMILSIGSTDAAL
ncbi:hypothetical protein [Spirosoma sordidisoli]|nr:hypothetical protein [Spirosoma sordidisoli]